MDRNRLRQKVLLNLAASPVTLIPCLLGLTLGTVLWSLSVKAGMWTLIAITSFLFGMGSCFTRLILGDDRVAKKSIDELQKEEQNNKERELDRLGCDLLKYNDSYDKSYTMLQNLRELYSSFRKTDVTVPNFSEISSSVEELFHGGIELLRQSIEIRKALKVDLDSSTRKTLSDKRNKLLQNVQKNIEAIANLLSSMSALTIGKSPGLEDQEKLREELATKLEVAKKVHSRMSEFEPNLVEDLGELKMLRKKKKEMTND